MTADKHILSDTKQAECQIKYRLLQLTSREREIVQLLAEGHSNKRIANLLDLSVKTVETHRAAVMRKLELSSLPDLVRFAIRNQIIRP